MDRSPVSLPLIIVKVSGSLSPSVAMYVSIGMIKSA